MLKFFYLFVAIIFEVVGTTALKQSEQFTKLWPSIMVVLMYVGAFYFLSLTLKTMYVGIAYAIWSGVGIVLISLLGALIYNQIPDLPAIIGLSLIIIGVSVLCARYTSPPLRQMRSPLYTNFFVSYCHPPF